MPSKLTSEERKERRREWGRAYRARKLARLAAGGIAGAVEAVEQGPVKPVPMLKPCVVCGTYGASVITPAGLTCYECKEGEADPPPSCGHGESRNEPKARASE